MYVYIYIYVCMYISSVTNRKDFHFWDVNKPKESPAKFGDYVMVTATIRPGTAKHTS